MSEGPSVLSERLPMIAHHQQRSVREDPLGPKDANELPERAV